MSNKNMSSLWFAALSIVSCAQASEIEYFEGDVSKSLDFSDVYESDTYDNADLQEINPAKVSMVSVYDLLKAGANLQYFTCCEALPFLFEPFPLSVVPEFQPYQGQFNETFILKIPDGRVCSEAGWVVIDNCFMEEFIWKKKQLGLKSFNTTKFENLKKYSGRVAVISQRGDGCYFHWITENLGRLALLEMQGIEYDWLYVSTRKPFMKESLILWGVDPAKIIEPTGENFYIQADELIVPSLVSKISAGYTRFASYVPDYILEYVAKKLSGAVGRLGLPEPECKRVFISRKDAKVRQMVNEDEVFDLFEAKGFARYDLSKMSLAQQINLFAYAQIVVGSHGAGLTNTLFCQPGTQVIEFFQARGSATYWYISQMLQLQHLCVKTTDFDIVKNGFCDTYVPLSIVEEVVQYL